MQLIKQIATSMWRSMHYTYYRKSHSNTQRVSFLCGRSWVCTSVQRLATL